MTIIAAVLVGREVPGWPEMVISPTVPLGKRYLVDLDSKGAATLWNLAHPEWGHLKVESVVDVQDGFPLPLCCLRLEI